MEKKKYVQALNLFDCLTLLDKKSFALGQNLDSKVMKNIICTDLYNFLNTRSSYSFLTHFMPFQYLQQGISYISLALVGETIDTAVYLCFCWAVKKLIECANQYLQQ